MDTPKGIVVFSGGSAANNLVDVFKTVRQNKKCPLSYVIPISDNGGSSSELIRVFGGPGKYSPELYMHSINPATRHVLTTFRYRRCTKYDIPSHKVL